MKIRVLFLLSVLVLTACDKIDNPTKKAIPTSNPTSTPIPTKIATTITLNLDGNLFNNDKLYLLSGDAAINIATITEGAPVTITSSDENVIAIDADGNVVPVGPGTATITIKVTESEKYTGATETVTIVVGRKVSLADETGTEFVAQNGDQITGIAPNTMHLSIPDGALVRLNDATIKPTSGTATAAIVCAGDATIILEGINDVKGYKKGYAGIQASPEGSKLTIIGATTTASMTASAGIDTSDPTPYSTAAAIGSNLNSSCGDIEICSGIITAISTHGAGIGAGAAKESANYSKCGNIMISGGKIISSSSNGAAIGSGCVYLPIGSTSTNTQSVCGDIIITDGEVEATTVGNPPATSYYIGAAIGTGLPMDANGKTTCGNIRISGGKVTAITGNTTKGSSSAAIGTAFCSNQAKGSTECKNIIIEGGVVIATNTAVGGSFGGPGIGVGHSGSDGGTNKCGNIEISGGTVTSNGGDNGAGIGTGYISGTAICGNINITGGLVVAHSATSSICDIGKGYCYGTLTIGVISLDATNGVNYHSVTGGYKYN